MQFLKDDIPAFEIFSVLVVSLMILIMLFIYLDDVFSEIQEEEYIALHAKQNDFYQPVLDLQQKYMKKGFIRGYQCRRLYALQKKIEHANSMTLARDLLK